MRPNKSNLKLLLMMLKNLYRQLRLLPGQRSRIDRRVFELQKSLTIPRPKLEREPQDNFLPGMMRTEPECRDEGQWRHASCRISTRWLLVMGDLKGGGDNKN
jgi:hypothetical protein